MSLTRDNLTRHDHYTSRRFRDPLALRSALQDRKAEIKDAVRSLDTGLPLPDAVVDRVAATSEGLLPMERYNIRSYHREPEGESVQSRVGGTSLGERMKNK
jgi:hypothetical protein